MRRYVAGVVVVALLSRFGFISTPESEALASWRQETIRNWAGLAIGRTEVLA